MAKFVEPKVELIPNEPIDKKIELCGRVCYKSEDKIIEDSSKVFIKKVIKNGHESVLEHASLGLVISKKMDLTRFKFNPLTCSYLFKYFEVDSDPNSEIYVITGNIRAWRDFIKNVIKRHKSPLNFENNLCEIFVINVMNSEFNYLFEDLTNNFNFLVNDFETPIFHMIIVDPEIRTFKITTDRAIANELVRHRVASFSQESTRYVNYANKEMEFISPYDYRDNNGLSELALTRWINEVEDRYNELIEEGIAPQFARNILPHCLKTELIMTANIKQWEGIIKLRTESGAHPSIAKLAEQIKTIIRKES